MNLRSYFLIKFLIFFILLNINFLLSHQDSQISNNETTQTQPTNKSGSVTLRITNQLENLYLHFHVYKMENGKQIYISQSTLNKGCTGSACSTVIPDVDANTKIAYFITDDEEQLSAEDLPDLSKLNYIPLANALKNVDKDGISTVIFKKNQNGKIAFNVQKV